MSELLLAFLIQISAAAMQPAEATLLFAGDAMMHSAQIDAARRSDGSYDFEPCFKPLKEYIQSADYAVVNLETPLGGAPYTGYPSFSAPDSYAVALSDAGFDMMLTANNHTLDKRDRGLKRTIATLDSLGITHIGTYNDAASRHQLVPYIETINGFRIAFFNYTYGTNGISVSGDAVVNYIDRDKIRADIEAARRDNAEIVTVCIHWGTEYTLTPDDSQRSLAQFLIDQGADIIIGGHPHVIQPLKMVEKENPDGTKHNVYLCYSLGNFLSNMKTDNTRGGALTTVTLKRDKDGKAVVDGADYRLVYVLPAGEGRSNFAVYPAESDMPSGWSARRDRFVTNATKIFDKYNVNVSRTQ